MVGTYLGATTHDDRRQILQMLADSPTGVCSVDDLVTALADGADDSLTDTERRYFRLQLYHVHLPKLADAPLVDYDWRSGDVVQIDRVPELRVQGR